MKKNIPQKNKIKKN